MITWDDAKFEWRAPKNRFYSIPLALLRSAIIILITLPLAILLILVRILEIAFPMGHFDIYIQRIWARALLVLLGLRLNVIGQCENRGGAVIANHSSWLDIIVFAAVSGGYFVSKAEIRNWPVAGWVARLMKTEFIIRDRSKSAIHVAQLRKRFEQGDRVLFYPEGTTTDGLTLIPFRTSLFEALADPVTRPLVQPMTIFYHAPHDASANFLGHWGGQTISTSFWAIAKRNGIQVIDVKFGQAVDDPRDRRSLCSACEQIIQSDFNTFKAKSTHPDLIEGRG